MSHESNRLRELMADPRFVSSLGPSPRVLITAVLEQLDAAELRVQRVREVMDDPALRVVESPSFPGGPAQGVLLPSLERALDLEA